MGINANEIEYALHESNMIIKVVILQISITEHSHDDNVIDVI